MLLKSAISATFEVPANSGPTVSPIIAGLVITVPEIGARIARSFKPTFQVLTSAPAANDWASAARTDSDITLWRASRSCSSMRGIASLPTSALARSSRTPTSARLARAVSAPARATATRDSAAATALL